MVVRIDVVLRRLLEDLGPIWFLVACVWLVAIVATRPHVAFGLGIALTFGTQLWIRGLAHIARGLRWWAVGILVLRGLWLLIQSEAPPGERKQPLIQVGLLGTLAVASALWAEYPSLAVAVGGSFAAGLLMSFWFMWRLADSVDVLASIGKWAVGAAFLLYGFGWLAGGYAAVSGDWELARLTGIDGRFSGMFSNPNGAGVFGAILLPIVIATPRAYLGALATIRLPAAIMLAATIPMTGSRSATAAASVALVVLFVYRYRIGGTLALGLLGTAVASLVIFTPPEDLQHSAVQHVIRSDSLADVGDRLHIWEKGWEAAQESPVIGLGWGASRVLNRVSVDEILMRGSNRDGTNMHNAHLQLLVDLGALGVGVFWWFLWSLVRASMRIIAAPRTPRRMLTMVFVASVFVVIADSLVHGWMFSMGTSSALLFWMFSALVLKESAAIRREREMPVVLRPASAPSSSPTHVQ